MYVLLSGWKYHGRKWDQFFIAPCLKKIHSLKFVKIRSFLFFLRWIFIHFSCKIFLTCDFLKFFTLHCSFKCIHRGHLWWLSYKTYQCCFSYFPLVASNWTKGNLLIESSRFGSSKLCNSSSLKISTLPHCRSDLQFYFHLTVMTISNFCSWILNWFCREEFP